MPNQPGQQADHYRTVETFEVDVCCVCETRTRDPTSTIAHCSTDTKSLFQFGFRAASDPVSTASGQAGVEIALTMRAAEHSLLDLTTVNNSLCAVLWTGYVCNNNRRRERSSPFVIASHAHIDCSSSETKDEC